MTSLPTTMAAVVVTGHGGLEKLEYRTDITITLGDRLTSRRGSLAVDT
ncbi:hypothetical protein [Enteractinococcus fodinae]|uniref:Uncharacterized protein n=1 Tax=Enteractinococcus fodinae TaxID=684663 RepID=A0ABU2B2F4_9MICC|nr:hypothetical protein [Enteractinococcus fodinae]MDR7347787.1 hypothetical protein [Enteractinococcus fodinae]